MTRYLVEYNHGGATWGGVEIHAESFEEAERKLRSLKTNARVIGEHVATIRVPSLLERLFPWGRK